VKLPPSPESWRRVAAILDRILDLPPEARAAALDEVCARSPELREEAEAYLAADEAADRFLDEPASAYAEALVSQEVAATVPVGSPADAGSPMALELGPYRVIREIGAGGMGVVYEGLDARLGRRVALKLLPPEWSRDAGAKERFVREARAAAALDHPNICNVHDVGESDDGQLFIVMAHYEGETLAHKIARGPLPPAEARELAIQVARGLERAHAAGIVHRDVKPSNIMVTEVEPGDIRASQGLPPDRAKILDFGIAQVAGGAGVTHRGESPGTPAYMSPEQASGDPVDERTDVWSLGVVLYEMLTGRRPFVGGDARAVIYQILNREPEPVEKLCPGLPIPLTRAVKRAMAKDPAQRQQSIAELRAELEHTLVPRSGRIGFPRWRPLAATLAAVAGLSALGGWWMTLREPPHSRPSMAVLRFENLAADERLEWLRYGLADLVITDLGQSPELDVLDLERLDRILDGERVPSAETPAPEGLEKLAGQAQTVLQGSFVLSGERLRINFHLREVESGEILLRDWVEDSRARLFAMVDEVSRRTRNALELPRHVELADSVEQVTTSSYEAWRFFAEGRELYRQSRWEEARSFLEEAISRDPEFALALADLANLHKNLGDDRLARICSRRAVEHAHRLPVQQRFFAEGEYHSTTWSGYGRAIAAYRRGVELFPDDLGLRSNLASHLAYLELHEQAAREYRSLLGRGDDFWGTHHGAGTVQGALGRFEEGHRILAEYARRNPKDGYARLALGWYLSEWNRYAEASEEIRRAEALRPDDLYVWQGWWRLLILREAWEEAAGYAGRMRASATAYGRWLSEVSTAWTQLYGGRSEAAWDHLAASARAYPEPEAYSALGHAWRARLALQTGRPEEALTEARRAREEAPGDWPELEGMFLEAIAHQALDRPGEADRIVKTLEERAGQMPNPVQERQLRHLAGRLALDRGDVEGALRELRAAVEMLPARGFWFHWHVLPDHVPLWYVLGEAELAAGRPDLAAEWFRRVAESGAEHLEHPVLFVRSFYRLGRCHEALGELEKAVEAYGRFHAYWQLGDLDRAEVEEAAVKSRAGFASGPARVRHENGLGVEVASQLPPPEGRSFGKGMGRGPRSTTRSCQVP